jgi:bla regulator protein BlaR1
MSVTPLIQALCWTLVHSLWQGLIAALIAGIIVLATKRSRPNLRYFLLTSLFFSLVLTCLGTFVWEAYEGVAPASSETAKTFEHIELNGGIPGAGTPSQSGQTWSITQKGESAPFEEAAPQPSPVFHWSHPRWGIAVQASQSIIIRIQRWCNGHASLIVLTWSFILLLKLGQTFLHLGYVHRIRRNKNFDAPLQWSDRLRELAHGIGLYRTILLKESALVQVPMVIGYLKPIILVPMGILAGLPADQLEAVLLHELAHIRRRDYLINILQSLAESLLFFNPAIWWISSLIRIERENCCDDVAISIHNKSHLIQALVAFQEYALEGPAYAVAFPGRKMHLLDRVRRILYNSNKTLNAMEKTMLALGLVALGTFTLAFSPVNPNRAGLERSLAHLKRATKHILILAKDTFPPASPVAPVAPVAPTASVQAPVPAAPVPAAPVPAAPVPSTPSLMAPAAPISGAVSVSPVSPLTAILAPASPMAPVARMDTEPNSLAVPPMPPVPPPPPVPDELKGGNFKGTLDMENGKITYIEGLWTNGKVVRYYMEDYKIVTKGGNIIEVYKAWKPVPLSDVNMDQMKGIIDYLTGREDGKAFIRQYHHSSESDTLSGTGTFNGTSTSPTSSSVSVSGSNGSSYSSSATSYTSSNHKMSISGEVLQGSGNVSATNYKEDWKGTSSGSGSSTGTGGSSTGTGGSSSANASAGTGQSNNVVFQIASEIMKEHLAQDSLNLSFKLDGHKLVINDITQPDNVYRSFRNLFLKDKGDSYSYARKDNSTTSLTSQNRSN